MCYVMSYQDEETRDDVDVCYFHDKITAQKIADKLSMRNFNRDYKVYNMPLYEVIQAGVPYCAEILYEEGIDVQ